MDEMSGIGLVGGAVATKMMGMGPALGAVLGMSTGVLVAAAYNNNHGDKTT